MNRKTRSALGRYRNPLLIVLAGMALLPSACTVGPKYQRPSAPVPVVYKEATPASSAETKNWKSAQPSDGVARGKWWEIYNDPQLNALEEQVSLSNQNLLVAETQYRQAKDALRVARSSLYPTVTAAPAITNVRAPSTSSSTGYSKYTMYELPGEASYVADLWGRIRRTAAAEAETAQASAALVESARLSYQAQLAQYYFELRGADGQQKLLERTVKSYEEYLQLTKDRFKGGVASGADVAQAETQLHSARAQLIDLGVARAQYEHAIAILIGKPPAELSIASAVSRTPPPPIPAGVPSTLLERRPDIAAAERQMASANEQIGIAKAAFYPTLTLAASGGLERTKFTKWFSWPSRFWSVGPELAQTIFDAGKRRAEVDIAQAAYEATVASYRQTVLTSFQQVEDNLAALRVLAEESEAEEAAVSSAQRSLEISTYQYKAGTASYLQVITAQTAALQNEISAVSIHTRRMTASVLLIEALGGGWNASMLPTVQEVSRDK